MPIYTKTTFISPPMTIPSEEDIARGMSREPDIAWHAFEAIQNGHTVISVRLEVEPEENGTQHFHIFREWFNAEQAQIHADINNQIHSRTPGIAEGFVGCVVITE